MFVAGHYTNFHCAEAFIAKFQTIYLPFPAQQTNEVCFLLGRNCLFSYYRCIANNNESMERCTKLVSAIVSALSYILALVRVACNCYSSQRMLLLIREGLTSGTISQCFW